MLAEATRISPGRRKSSDGACGDAAHAAEVSDHNPSGPNNYCHAVDVSQSTPGAPFWLPTYGQFDAHAYARQIAARRDPRVKYIVIGQPNGPDIIWAPDHDWRQNGSYKTDHRSHAHFSFWSIPAVEQSTAPFFGTPKPPEEDMPLNAADAKMIRDIVKQELHAILGGDSLVPPIPEPQTIAKVIKHYTT